MSRFKVIFLTLFFVLATHMNVGGQEPRLEYNRDIRPILSDNCFLCHGPAESTRAADLRLDDYEAALAAAVLNPGNPEASEFMDRILSDDVDLQMPPPDSNKKLSDAQKRLLQRWIAEGAQYQEHWSFVPPKKSVDVGTANPVDYFTQRRLKMAGLDLSPAADLNVLIRRVTLDLTGLPPTPQQVAAFIEDSDHRGIDVAYAGLVDRLLSSPAYGERMALAWLDAARYGDTSVMHADGPRDMWPWRDWVINAYNANMPFDQFTIEQLAGDLIPDASMEQKIAAGFNRNHATSDEGGAFAEELRVEYVVDRVQTTSTVWLGLTMECSQCHDHKYDPISQKEYYQFFAYFNNTTDPGMQTRDGNQTPVVNVIDDEYQAKLTDLELQVESARKNLEDHRQSIEPMFAAWAQQATVDASESGEYEKDLAGLVHWYPLDESEGNELNNQLTGTSATLEKGKLESAERDGGAALKLNGSTQFICPQDSPTLKNDEPFSFTAWIKSDGKSGGAVFSRMDVANGYRGYDLWIQGRNVGSHIIHDWPTNALKVVSQDQLQTDVWQHVVVSYDGSQKAEGIKIYIDGKLSANKVEADTLNATIETDVPFKIGSRSTGANWKGEVDDIRIYEQALSEADVSLAKRDPVGGILATAPDQRSEEQIQILRRFYLANEDKVYQDLNTELAKVTKQLSETKANPVTSMTMQDNPESSMRMTFVLDRGQYDAPKKEEPITQGVPAALPPLPNDAPPNRLGLAQWLTQPDHPLTARVAVNRYWMMFFGEGLVRTVGDFGAQGAPPTHPDLLDWLAVDFVQSGWDVKRMVKQLVMSKTYRQSSRQEPAHRQHDPTNQWLAHSPRFRLQGEMIRDQALAVSGLLVDQLGGPGVKPYQPPNIWNEVSLNGGLRYPQDKGEKLYRKSLYTYWKRSSPMPSMLIFDAPSREKCVVQRARTNTPLQALVTLNDPQFVEAARALAQRLIQSESEDERRIELAYQLCTSRSANHRERDIVERLLNEQRQLFAASPESATKLLAVGESQRDESIEPCEHAAWTVIAQMILNLDETLTRS
ncbi:DUF1553 domain-containing protein [Neorhodopirellula pilleata]|uniref:Planctomycete cytochrome C n=1 Tax=Neorhodopirellula pilleata TaxID=2714738 RepID=A0A5C6ALE7_9BACT|nr:DUF1553 domain-containing protein [Neorhodopirellula pilleata]TWT98993.1 Planctomycete cytochrome C [Neorhodopirellula pilleata]